MAIVSPQQQVSLAHRSEAAQSLIKLLSPLLAADADSAQATAQVAQPGDTLLQAISCKEILSAIETLVSTLCPENSIFATFHDGKVHDPLGGGSYAFQKDLVEPVLLALLNDEILANDKRETLANTLNRGVTSSGLPSLQTQLPTRPIVIHAGAQPNNSPHAGTLVVFCYAFCFAQQVKKRMEDVAANADLQLPSVTVEVTFMDTAPVIGHEFDKNQIQYQKSYREVPDNLDVRMLDYKRVLDLLSKWSDIDFRIVYQSEFFSHPSMPSILGYIIANHETLGPQLSPKHGTLALRAACPVSGCGLAEKHGRLNMYSIDTSLESYVMDASATDAIITFHCPFHGPHTISLSKPGELSRLEANAPTRNLIRSMRHLLDKSVHHVRITGSDYAGMYQEVFLYRPLANWSSTTGLATGRTPHILYAPLVVDWSGAKLSKSLYVREGGYETMELFGTDGLCSFAQLKRHFNDDGQEGLRRLWNEVK